MLADTLVYGYEKTLVEQLLYQNSRATSIFYFRAQLNK